MYSSSYLIYLQEILFRLLELLNDKNTWICLELCNQVVQLKLRKIFGCLTFFKCLYIVLPYQRQTSFHWSIFSFGLENREYFLLGLPMLLSLVKTLIYTHLNECPYIIFYLQPNICSYHRVFFHNYFHQDNHICVDK